METGEQILDRSMDTFVDAVNLIGTDLVNTLVGAIDPERTPLDGSRVATFSGWVTSLEVEPINPPPDFKPWTPGQIEHFYALAA
jgi:hypothetical protein